MTDSPYIQNVTAETFQSLVIDNSFKQPVLVDFWAEWCNPCQVLLPLLGQLADEYKGAFILAKVNSDEQGELAAQMGVKSLPTVKLIINGEMVNEFMGALPESEIRQFLDPYIQTQSDHVLTDAMAAFEAGNEAQALEMLNTALANDPKNANLKIKIAQLVFAQGDQESANSLLDSLSEDEKGEPAAKELIAQIKLAAQLKDIGDPIELQNRIEKDPDDLEAILQMSQYQLSTGNHEAAIQLLMSIMQKDRSFNDDAGRLGLIEIFEMLGNDHPLVQSYRRKMFTLLH